MQNIFQQHLLNKHNKFVIFQLNVNEVYFLRSFNNLQYVKVNKKKELLKYLTKILKTKYYENVNL